MLVKIYIYFLFFLISFSILRLLFILGLYENGKNESAAIPSGDIYSGYMSLTNAVWNCWKEVIAKYYLMGS